jgi:ABC-type antimicrobial peptide transport system permease subunit
MVGERHTEIAIRMAIGAAPTAILRHYLLRAFRLAVLGLALGLAGAFAATRVLQNLLYDVTPGDPATFASVSALLLAAALSAAAWPARRATQVSPMVALRGG